MRQKCTDAKNILNMGKPKWNKPTQVIRVLLTLTEIGKVDIIIHSTLDFLVKYTVSKNAKGRTTHMLDAFWYLYQTKPCTVKRTVVSGTPQKINMHVHGLQ